MNLHGKLHQQDYLGFNRATAEWVGKAWKNSVEKGELTPINNDLSQEMYKGLSKSLIKAGGPVDGAVYTSYSAPDLIWDHLNNFQKARQQERLREEFAKSIVAGIWKNEYAPGAQGPLAKAGVTSALGYNFYDLRAPVALLYPVNVPIRNSLPRVGRVNDGYGTAAHWMATRNPGGVYAGVSEGNRNSIGTPDNNQYLAAYKEIGDERAATFTSQFAGEGFADNLADEHIRGLHTLFLQEEGMMLLGNSGVAGSGFKLGTANTPTVVLNAVTTGGFSGNTNVSVAVVFLTGLGNPANVQYGYVSPITVAGGLTPNYTRTNADGSKDVINGGGSAISAMSTVASANSTHQTVTATVVPKPGTFGYAWYVNVTDASAPALSNAFLYSVTTTNSVTITAAATGTQAGNFTGVGTGNNLATDNSFNSLDFDGLLTYCVSTTGAYYKDLGGASFVSQKNGRVAEIETALQTIFTNYQAPIDCLWCSPDAAESLDAAVRYTNNGTAGMQIHLTRDQQNNLMGGFVVSAYQSRFAVANPMGANSIPIRIHPMVPPGTIYLEVSTNPYPHSRAPFVRAMLVQRDYYSIEWPVTSRQWTFGTYVHEVLAHYMPWIPGVITNIGAFSQST